MIPDQSSDSQTTEWLKSLPTKSVAAKVIIRSSAGNILLVKPTYKPGWQFPGGGVEAQEDVKDAAIRELREELGITLEQSSLRLCDSVLRLPSDNLILLYELTQPIDEKTPFTIQESEIESYKFYPPSEVGSLIGAYYESFWGRYNSET